MIPRKLKLFPTLETTLKLLQLEPITEERKEVLNVLIDYIQQKLDKKEAVNLNFICTHNSRRSQFSQIWAQTAADYYDIETSCYSGGVEVTAFNKRAVDAIKRAGFNVTQKGEDNPIYHISYSTDVKPISIYSKLYDDFINPITGFAAIITCSPADENCPFIPGAEKRIPVRYKDPKEFDDTSHEAIQYDERSKQIASEMFYVFSQLKS